LVTNGGGLDFLTEACRALGESRRFLSDEGGLLGLAEAAGNASFTASFAT